MGERSEQNNFVWRSTIMPVIIAVGLNVLLIGGVVVGKQFSKGEPEIRPVKVTYEVLGESTTPTPTPINEPPPEPAIEITTTPSPSPTPEPQVTIIPEGPYKKYINSSYNFSFNYPASWEITATTYTNCQKSSEMPFNCQQLVLSTPSKATLTIRYSSETDSGRMNGDVPAEKMDIPRVGYTRFNGKLIYWNLLAKDNKRTFICYGQRYKNCERKIFTLNKASFYIFGGSTTFETAPSISDADMNAFHKVVESISNLE